MRPITPESPINDHRITDGPCGSTRFEPDHGAFQIQLTERSTAFLVFSSELGWEHLSAHVKVKSLRKGGKTKMRIPTWSEMNRFKDLFWEDDEAVIQIHPVKSDYINNHDFCLHLWRSTEEKQPLPPSIMVGLKQSEIQNLETIAIPTREEIERQDSKKAKIVVLDPGAKIHIRFEADADQGYAAELMEACAKVAMRRKPKS